MKTIAQETIELSARLADRKGALRDDTLAAGLTAADLRRIAADALTPGRVDRARYDAACARFRAIGGA